MAFSAGVRLGPYEILSPLGAGGMGEVYRARDTRLDREVAIEVLPAELASGTERLKRFEKEARSASSLNHPNIVTMFRGGRLLDRDGEGKSSQRYETAPVLRLRHPALEPQGFPGGAEGLLLARIIHDSRARHGLVKPR
jgi:serine/threonine protein kinase